MLLDLDQIIATYFCKSGNTFLVWADPRKQAEMLDILERTRI